MGTIPVVLYLSSIVTLCHGEIFSAITLCKRLVAQDARLRSIVGDYILDQEESLETIPLKAELLTPIKKVIANAKKKLKMTPIIEDNESGLLYADHPINTFHLMKFWNDLFLQFPGLRQNGGLLSFTRKKRITLPNDTDVTEAAVAIIRLQRTYKLKVKPLAMGYIRGHFSQQTLSPEDMLLLGRAAMQEGEFSLAAQWCTYAISVHKSLEREQQSALLEQLYYQLALANRQIGDLSEAVKAVSKANDISPDNKQIASNMMQMEEALGREKSSGKTMYTWKRAMPQWLTDYEALCRKPQPDRPAKIQKKLRCRYKPGMIPYDVFKEEILNIRPYVSVFYNVTSKYAIKVVKRLATPLLYRAETVQDDGTSLTVSRDRVSQVAWLGDLEYPNNTGIMHLSKRVSELTGLNTKQRPGFSSSEDFQVINYGIGGQYEPHYDFLDDMDKFDATGASPGQMVGTGNRIATLLFYLTDTEAGGSTVFPKLGIKVSPIKNSALFWYNFSPIGEKEDKTQHGACPILLGEKWVINKWIRQHGQEFVAPCPLRKRDPWLNL